MDWQSYEVQLLLRQLSIKIMKLLYITLNISEILYELEFWTLRKSDENNFILENCGRFLDQ